MSSNAEPVYDSFLASLGKILPKIDVELAMKVMYYERKFPDVEPCVSLDIHYKDRTNLIKKQHEYSSRYGFSSARMEQAELSIRGNMNLGTVQEISNDPDVTKITGSVTCASY